MLDVKPSLTNRKKPNETRVGFMQFCQRKPVSEPGRFFCEGTTRKKEWCGVSMAKKQRLADWTTESIELE